MAHINQCPAVIFRIASVIMANQSTDSESSVENISSQRIVRQMKREFVWLKEKRNSIPRGRDWDLLNREGRVQEITFKLSMDSHQLTERVKEVFPGLSNADFSR